MEYGFHRVITPKGTIPQTAWKLDNTPATKTDYEILVDVRTLCLDSTSMRQLKEKYNNIEQRILEIINERGKMHNPETNSGGILIGNVEDIGQKLTSFALQKGDTIIPLASLSTIPLSIDKIENINGEQINVQGKAILFQSTQYTKLPQEYSQKPTTALAALDISSIVPQIYRHTKEGQTILVIGTGKAGMTAMAAARQTAQNAHIIGTDTNRKQLTIAYELGYADKLIEQNAQQPEEFLKTIEEATNGKLCDLTINCVNAPNTETATILATKQHGTAIFFSMATQFDKAALGTDATGKDITMIIGNGIAEKQAQTMFELLNKDQRLKTYFEKHHTQ